MFTLGDLLTAGTERLSRETVKLSLAPTARPSLLVPELIIYRRSINALNTVAVYELYGDHTFCALRREDHG